MEKVAIFAAKMVTFPARNIQTNTNLANFIKLYIFSLLYNISPKYFTKLYSFTNFKMSFQVVVKVFAFLA